MVLLTIALRHVPKIKFRKGGAPARSPAAAAAAPAPAAASAPAAGQPAKSMTTSATVLADIDLPLRYRRQPLSSEEIDHINGGGIRGGSKDSSRQKPGPAAAVIRIPKGVLVRSGKQQESVNLNIIIENAKKS